ncbi:MAG: D-alanyl-D-alanine carboxypeptidase [Beijerinckiaceae bacterium]|nr:D-alanyl-D-alanine carboxypeptidase [Beijerinckiaceae bacterium]
MRSPCVAAVRWPLSPRLLATILLALVMTAALVVPEAEARRKRHRAAGGGYNPPYASMVYDVNSGRVLEATNGDALRHPASVTKVMTLYMLFEQLETGRFKLSTELPVSREAASQSPSKIGLRPGETIAVEDAIKALVTKSANDVAVVVAEAIGGEEERFAAMMTRKARSIGMKRTTFRNASGLPNPSQWTTARDLVTLGRAIQDRFPRYYHYFGTRNFAFEGRAYRNHNRLLGQVEGVDGIKTGYTRASGFNLLTSAKADGRHLIAVVLGGRSGRARDAQVASLIENHMDRAYAGRRMTAKAVEVARAPDEDDEIEEGSPARPAAAALPPARTAQRELQPPPAPVGLMAAPAAAAPAGAMPLPPSRPRPAVIAETGPRQQAQDDPGLTRTRPLALSSSGSTNIVASATTPLALVGTTPRSPAMRWQAGPGASDLPPPRQAAPRDEQRLVPPGSIRYTNSIPGEAPKAEESQALPAAAPAPRPAPEPRPAEIKAEERLPTMQRRAEIAAITPPPQPEAARPAPAVAAAPAPARPAPEAARAPAPAPAPAVAVREPAKTAPARTGWVIQLAAAESDAKARSILDQAIEKTGRALKAAEPFTEAVTKGGTTLYRARFAGFDAEEAQAACKTLKRSGFNCFAQKM